MVRKWYDKIDPKIKVRKGAEKTLFKYLFTPLTELIDIEIPTLLYTEHIWKKPKSVQEFRNLRKQRFVTYRLFSKGLKIR